MAGARVNEGLAKGYPRLPGLRTRAWVRCDECDRLLAEVISVPWRITCVRCKTPNGEDRPGGAVPEKPER